MRLLPLLSLMSFAAALPRVLVYTRTLGYRHDSIPTAIEVLRTNAGNKVEFEFTEDPTQFTDTNLARFDALMFVSTSEEVLDGPQQAAMARYFRAGGAYIGVHSASACLYNDSDYLNAVGAYFDYHPDLQPATFVRLNDTHPATAGVPDRWRFTEEVYFYRGDPRTKGAVVLLTVDEESYTNNAGSTGNYPPQGDPHPIAWYIETPAHGDLTAPKAGRSFYTSLGHLNETWTNETFIPHVFGGLEWALEGRSTRAYGVGIVGNDGSAPISSSSGSVVASGTPGAGAGGGAGGGATPTGSAAGSGSAASSEAPAKGTGRAGRPAAAAAVVGGALAAGLLIIL